MPECLAGKVVYGWWVLQRMLVQFFFREVLQKLLELDSTLSTPFPGLLPSHSCRTVPAEPLLSDTVPASYSTADWAGLLWLINLHHV